jgi:hypothetical protein
MELCQNIFFLKSFRPKRRFVKSIPGGRSTANRSATGSGRARKSALSRKCEIPPKIKVMIIIFGDFDHLGMGEKRQFSRKTLKYL